MPAHVIHQAAPRACQGVRVPHPELDRCKRGTPWRGGQQCGQYVTFLHEVPERVPLRKARRSLSVGMHSGQMARWVLYSVSSPDPFREACASTWRLPENLKSASCGRAILGSPRPATSYEPVEGASIALIDIGQRGPVVCCSQLGHDAGTCWNQNEFVRNIDRQQTHAASSRTFFHRASRTAQTRSCTYRRSRHTSRRYQFPVPYLLCYVSISACAAWRPHMALSPQLLSWVHGRQAGMIRNLAKACKRDCTHQAQGQTTPASFARQRPDGSCHRRMFPGFRSRWIIGLGWM